MTRPSGIDFLVGRSDWSRYRFEASPVPELGEGQVLFRIDRFAFTANNISYALTGDMLGYWRFFPAPEGRGRIPTMGFGDVIESNHPAVAVGTRCFGFHPMSRDLRIEPRTATCSRSGIRPDGRRDRTDGAERPRAAASRPRR